MTSTLSGVPGGSFYGYDGHGNVRYLTGSAGTATDTYVYDAFGMPITTTGTTPNSFLYSGEQFDNALGMYYLRARYYNPATGRFLAMDSYEGSILDPATLHKYLYAGNNPVNASDPTGRDLFEQTFVEGGSLPAYPGLRAVAFSVADVFCYAARTLSTTLQPAPPPGVPGPGGISLWPLRLTAALCTALGFGF